MLLLMETERGRACSSMYREGVIHLSGPKHEAHIGFHDAVAKAFLHEALDVRRQSEDDPLIVFSLPKDARDFGV